MWISNSHRVRALLYLKDVNFTSPSFSFSHHRFSTNNTSSSDSHSFAVSYLITNFGFSPQSASKLCSTYNVRFKTAENPNSVLTFFTNHGFSDSQLHNMIAKAPWLLSCYPYKRVLPKFQFLLSKGISNANIVNLVSKYPQVLSPSLKNKTVPTYELLYRFLQSDKDIFVLYTYHPTMFGGNRMARNIRMLVEIGMKDSCIARVLRARSRVLESCESHMVKLVEELKDLGFHPSKSTFAVALVAKIVVSRRQWNKKGDAFNKWGWSDEDIVEAFRKNPHCMLTSVHKINLVMSFWVNNLGWDPLVLVKRPHVISSSLERTIIPRATVVQFLINKGLRNKNASLLTPFHLPEKLFVDKFITPFVEDSSHLLNLYEEKLNVASTTNNRERTLAGLS